MKITNEQSGTLRQACGIAIVVQVVILLVLSLILDGGELARSFLACIVIHWLSVLVIWIRRGKRLTTIDMAIVKAGFIVYFGLLIAGTMIYNALS